MDGSWGISGSQLPKAPRNKGSQILNGAIQAQFQEIIYK